MTMMPVATVSIPSAARDSLKNEAAKRFSNQGEFLRALEAAFDAAKTYPPLTEMIIGRDGIAWIGLTERDGVHPYIVLDAAGGVQGTVNFPAQARVAEAQSDRIWVIERDEYDVESLVLYRVAWGSS